uniref:Truncated TMEM154 n=1 Tax=Ovis aries TaxID=9940 RepID=A0A140YIA1_SHEEP|nr:truncated TMEM154 [Ovis aries]AIZ49175.1 truncated TMEM154 [Ovis aries]AIZ49176.1 truncated TMEM154 [Ovis aries]AIZ49177.1 truncated TMEM154 [Ovis aries]
MPGARPPRLRAPPFSSPRSSRPFPPARRRERRTQNCQETCPQAWKAWMKSQRP